MVHACKFEKKKGHFAGSPIPQESIKSCYCFILCHSWFKWGTCMEMNIAQNQQLSTTNVNILQIYG